ncbi:MAG: biotin--[acetyl-CoA-carboxylase] ligase [Clostridiales bacterium]|nr:biotin--[acetyl-CoA-carboxylase] ligase [Clostridiales bacterium]
MERFNKAISESGYCLKTLETYIHTRNQWAGRNIVYYDSIDSTNNEAKRLGKEGALHGTLVIAQQQTAGRGRLGRNWDSPKEQAIYMTLLIRPNISPQNASKVTLIAALAAAKGIREVAGMPPQIKWPNDIVIHGKKLCGILTEMNMESENKFFLVVGIGINCNRKDFPEELKQTATSLYLETKKEQSREQLIAAVMYAFEQYYSVFIQTENLSNLKQQYECQLVNYNRDVRVLSPDHEYIGTSRGINEEGELLVEDKSGQMHAVRSGEVSVRGIYGYTI